jgi:hypothetical protein
LRGTTHKHKRVRTGHFRIRQSVHQFKGKQKKGIFPWSFPPLPTREARRVSRIASIRCPELTQKTASPIPQDVREPTPTANHDWSHQGAYAAALDGSQCGRPRAMRSRALAHTETSRTETSVRGGDRSGREKRTCRREWGRRAGGLPRRRERGGLRQRGPAFGKSAEGQRRRERNRG